MTTTTTTVEQRGTALEAARPAVRTTLAGLWTTVLFAFAYVDLFSFYRPDFRAEVERGEVAGFTVDGFFLLWTTSYVLLAALLIAGSLLLPARVARLANLVLAPLYATSIGVAATGEMGYFVLGSMVEVLLLAAIVRVAWTWPRG